MNRMQKQCFFGFGRKEREAAEHCKIRQKNAMMHKKRIGSGGRTGRERNGGKINEKDLHR